MSPEPEFSRPIDLETIGAKPVSLSLEPDDGERVAIAARLSLPALSMLTARVTFQREADGETVLLSGQLDATLMQACVRTLEPIPTTIEDVFTERLRPVAAEAVLDEDQLDLEAAVDALSAEPIPGGVIDIGDIVVQYLALALPSHPIADGADFEGLSVDTTPAGSDPGRDETVGRQRPFADLAARLKRDG